LNGRRQKGGVENDTRKTGITLPKRKYKSGERQLLSADIRIKKTLGA